VGGFYGHAALGSRLRRHDQSENISGIALVPPETHDGARTRVRCFDGEVHMVRESPVKIRALLRAEIQTLSGALDRLYA
jgi:hypothetical protein